MAGSSFPSATSHTSDTSAASAAAGRSSGREPAAAAPGGRPSLRSMTGAAPFVERHIGTSAAERAKMLALIGCGSEEELVAAAVPRGVADDTVLALPEPVDEAEVLRELRGLAGRNRVLRSMIGMGYYGTVTPAVIRRNVLENPAWYTAYTPYQPEIAQGRLEALLNFQTMVEDLTALPVANASLLDEGSAAAEAMALARRVSKVSSARFVVDAGCFPQTRAVVGTRAEPLGIEVVVADLAEGLPEGEFFGVLVQYPADDGSVRDWSGLAAQAHGRGAVVVMAADLLALTLVRAPGEMGADVAVGTTQRFGVPMGFGGPHAAYMAVRAGLERSLPGRLVGVSRDAAGRPAFRLALQTREQHIRRERATSNICTAQVLLAVMASMYAVWHGPEGLVRIAGRVHRCAVVLAEGLRGLVGVEVCAPGVGAGGGVGFFDTVVVRVPGRAAAVVAAAERRGVNVRLVDGDRVGLSCDETTSVGDVEAVWGAFVEVVGGVVPEVDVVDAGVVGDGVPAGLVRRSGFLTHRVFHEHRSEAEMVRYLRRLADRDVALDRSMIPLGSCTMKLNAAVEMEAVSWPEFADLHPFVPAGQAEGLLRLVGDLEGWLAEMTGFAAVSVQPNAGSQGELAGLLAVRAFHRSRGEGRRTVCLIPSSAHGTNAASAVMAGLRVVVVACRPNGDVDVADLREKVARFGDELAVLMVTYPSTHGVFEGDIAEVCGLVHEAGGQVYVDGANLNALVGVARPGWFGADVSHLNLHKTFCIPHGGGGPGVGPVAVREHLVPFLPGHPLPGHSVGREVSDGGGVGPVASAPWGSAGILPISWAYVRLMGGRGLVRATRAAVTAANYVARRLEGFFPVLFTGPGGLVAHECVVDLRPLTEATGVSVDDVAKRLIDFGFHAPTVSFPVAGTLMIEPTESEGLAELDRFCAAMAAIRGEIDQVAAGVWPVEVSPLRQAPHTAAAVSASEWGLPYPREVGAFPAGRGAEVGKYWPPVGRVDGAFGDRNLVCSCPAPEAFAEE